MSIQFATRSAIVIVLTAAGMLMSGCAAKRPVVTHAVPLNFEDRHPINVGYQTRELTIEPHPASQGMTPADRTKLIGFLRAYRNDGESVLQVITPSGGPGEAFSHAIVSDIRALATDEGIAAQNLYIYPYDAGGDMRAPVRLSFGAFAASVEGCGQWPSRNSGNYQNTEYYNFGCAAQSNLARMVADPRDLTGPRAETPSDANRRRTVFEKYRRGEDTATRREDRNAGQASQVGK